MKKNAIVRLSLFVRLNAQSLNFDGSDDYVDMGSASSVSINGNITISAWVLFSDFNNHTATVVSKVSDGLNNGFAIEGSGIGNADKLSFWVGDDSDFIEVRTNSLSINNWYHVVGTNDGSTSKIYVNGVLANSTSQGNPAGPTGNLKIGRHSTITETDNTTRRFSGNIDEVAIWSSVLTADEVAALADSGAQIVASSNSGDYVSSDNLVGYWRFNEGSGTTTSDATSNGNDGTINGATWSDNSPLEIVDEKFELIPQSFILNANYPNPFNPTTTISYDLPEQSQITLGIYDLLGKQIKTLVNQSQDAGRQIVMWDGTDVV